MSHIRLQSSTIEALTVTIRATADPTGSDIEFAVTAIDTEDDDIATWDAGTWGTYANGTVTATTPTVGATGADIELPDSTPLILWSRIGGQVVDRAATLFID